MRIWKGILRKMGEGWKKEGGKAKKKRMGMNGVSWKNRIFAKNISSHGINGIDLSTVQGTERCATPIVARGKGGGLALPKGKECWIGI